MSTLLLVRHAQASFFEEDYDRLSELGETQARCLGRYLAERNIAFDQVFTGPARRHRRTADLVGVELVAAGLPWSEPIVLPELHEHKADELLKKSADDLSRRDASFAQLVAAYRDARERAEINRAFQKLFEAVVHLWSENALGVDGIEPWTQFTARVERGIGSIVGGQQRSRRVLAFSSVGPITIFLKHALATTDRKALELGWRLRNCSMTEFVFTDGRITLDCFNALPHLDRAELITFR